MLSASAAGIFTGQTGSDPRRGCIPAGGDIPDPIENLSFAHKLCFMDDISEFLEQRKGELKDKKILFCGDFNVAHNGYV